MRLAAKGRVFPPKTPVSVTIYAGINHQRDLDNIVKPTLDTSRRPGSSMMIGG